MMMTSLIAFAALAQTAPAPASAAQAAGPTAGPLISKMLARYAAAQTLSGQIATVQTASDRSIHTTTVFQSEQPSKFYFSQTMDGDDGGKWLLTSDGVRFSYNRPHGTFGPDRYVEDVMKPAGATTVKEMYAVAGSVIGEKSPPLDIAFGRLDDLKRLKAIWGPMQIAGRTKFNGIDANVVRGGFRVAFNGPLVGEVEMVVTDDGDLLRYTTQQKVAASTKPSVVVNVVTDWQCNIKVNGPVDESLFALVK